MIRSSDAIRLSANSPGIPEAEGVDVLVHVGPHKTGTTWLQKQFFPKLEGVVYTGDVPRIYSAFMAGRFGKFSLDAVSKALGPDLKIAHERKQPLVISAEVLGGRPFGQMSLREVTAHRIKAAFPNATIMVSVREQTAILNSMYGEYLRYGHSSKLQDFINQETGNPNIQPVLEIDYYDYVETLDFYESVFGVGKVIVAPLEWFTKAPEALAQRLGQALDAEISLQVNAIRRSQENPAFSPIARHVQRYLNKFYPADTRNRTRKNLRFAPNTIASKIDRLVPDGMRKRGLAAQQDLIAKMVGSRFAQSNRDLANRTGLDLGSLGYEVAP